MLKPATKKILLLLIIFLALAFLSSKPIFAQVVINEFSSATSEDWVELYNNADEEIDFFEYTLIDGSDSESNLKTFACVFSPRGFYVVPWSNKLNNAGDIIFLKSDTTVVDCVSYGDGAGQVCEGRGVADLEKLEEAEVGVRETDGVGSWSKTTTASKGGPNDGSDYDSSLTCFVPTPTSTPTVTPTPMNTPAPTNTPKPTATPKPPIATSTPTPTLTPTSTSKFSLTPTVTPEGEVLSEEKEATRAFYPLEKTGEAAPPATAAGESQSRPWLARGILGLGLLLLGGTAFYLWYNFGQRAVDGKSDFKG